MSVNNRLTIEEAQKVSMLGMGGNSFDNICNLAKQLLDIMRDLESCSEHLAHNEELCLKLQSENEKLRKFLSYSLPANKYCSFYKEANGLLSNKESDNE